MEQQAHISNEAEFQRWLTLTLELKRRRLAEELAGRESNRANVFFQIQERAQREGDAE